MFYLGIDIAKNTHVASLMDEKGKITGFQFILFFTIMTFIAFM